MQSRKHLSKLLRFAEYSNISGGKRKRRRTRKQTRKQTRRK